MDKFRIGLTRDFLNQQGELKFQIGIEQFDKYPNIEYEFLKEFTPEVTPEQIKDYDVVISLLPKFTKQSFKGVERLTAIARCGVGYEMTDLNTCSEADIACFILPRKVYADLLQFRCLHLS